jgi:hypothetical protein
VLEKPQPAAAGTARNHGGYAVGDQHHQSLNFAGYEHRFKNNTQKNRVVSFRRRNVALN